MESYCTRDWTYVPCIGRWILSHWTTREALFVPFLMRTTTVSSWVFTLSISFEYLPYPNVWPRRRWWHPTPVLLPGKSHGWRSLVGCSPWGREESDTTERLYFHFSLSCVGEGNGNPLQCSCLENPRDGGAWWAAVYGVAQSRTWLKQLSSSSSNVWPAYVFCMIVLLCMDVCLSMSASAYICEWMCVCVWVTYFISKTVLWSWIQLLPLFI